MPSALLRPMTLIYLLLTITLVVPPTLARPIAPFALNTRQSSSIPMDREVIFDIAFVIVLFFACLGSFAWLTSGGTASGHPAEFFNQEGGVSYPVATVPWGLQEMIPAACSNNACVRAGPHPPQLYAPSGSEGVRTANKREGSASHLLGDLPLTVGGGIKNLSTRILAPGHPPNSTDPTKKSVWLPRLERTFCKFYDNEILESKSKGRSADTQHQGFTKSYWERLLQMKMNWSVNSLGLPLEKQDLTGARGTPESFRTGDPQLGLGVNSSFSSLLNKPPRRSKYENGYGDPIICRLGSNLGMTRWQAVDASHRELRNSKKNLNPAKKYVWTDERMISAYISRWSRASFIVRDLDPGGILSQVVVVREQQSRLITHLTNNHATVLSHICSASKTHLIPYKTSVMPSPHSFHLFDAQLCSDAPARTGFGVSPLPVRRSAQSGNLATLEVNSLSGSPCIGYVEFGSQSVETPCVEQVFYR
ncbi:hypothetical protein EDB87DRAFT_1577058 [Lactarius vividus]|nr:hypothetical protein EDB87DRAFT_1577058 [Lactarius vividus]